jgi:L-iditol 2-dehydrogenase
MKSYILQKPKKLVLESKPSQQIPSKEYVKVKVDVAGISTADLEAFNGKCKSELPFTLGRQAVGIISEVYPDGGSEFQKGDKVIIGGFEPCGKCFFCKSGEPHKCENMNVLGYNKDGIFSDFVIVPSSIVYRLPDNMHYETAIFAEYVSMALNIIDKLNLKQGDHVAIMCANQLGFLLAQLITYYQGIAIVIDENKEQLTKLGNENISYTLNSKDKDWKEQVSGITGGRMCDKVVYITESNLSVMDATDICGINGCICLAGFTELTEQCPLANIHNKQINVVSVKHAYGNFPSAINMLATKVVNPKQIVGKVFRFAELPEKMLSTTYDEMKYQCYQFRID